MTVLNCQEAPKTSSPALLVKPPFDQSGIIRRGRIHIRWPSPNWARRLPCYFDPSCRITDCWRSKAFALPATRLQSLSPANRPVVNARSAVSRRSEFTVTMSERSATFRGKASRCMFGGVAASSSATTRSVHKRSSRNACPRSRNRMRERPLG